MRVSFAVAVISVALVLSPAACSLQTDDEQQESLTEYFGARAAGFTDELDLLVQESNTRRRMEADFEITTAALEGMITAALSEEDGASVTSSTITTSAVVQNVNFTNTSSEPASSTPVSNVFCVENVTCSGHGRSCKKL